MPFYKEENRGSFLGREEFVCREAQGQRAEYPEGCAQILESDRPGFKGL